MFKGQTCQIMYKKVTFQFELFAEFVNDAELVKYTYTICTG